MSLVGEEFPEHVGVAMTVHSHWFVSQFVCSDYKSIELYPLTANTTVVAKSFENDTLISTKFAASVSRCFCQMLLWNTEV